MPNNVMRSAILSGRPFWINPILMLLTAAFLLSGCSGTMFTAYPKKINPMIAELKAGTPPKFDQLLLEECNGSDSILYNMERGRVAHIVDNHDASMKDFNSSIEKINLNSLKAVVSASSLLEGAGAIMMNDNAISYESEGYERVMLHHYQALNYLNNKNLDGAGVEVRRANSEQEEALKIFESEIEKAQKDAEEKNVSGIDRSVIVSQYAQLDEVAGKVKNSFQNAYTFYISGFIYELLNQPNDAYIDYKKALEIYPENSYLQKDVIRLAASLTMADDLEALKARFNLEPLVKTPSNGESGELLVIYEDGFAPQKEEVKIPLPIPNAGIVTLAFPIYRERWSPPSLVSISADNQLLGSTEPICDIQALAVKSLKERVPALATRQIIRAVSKGLTNHVAKKKLGGLGELGMSVINFATENADLRSWVTLPSNVQLLRATLSTGGHKITIKSDRGDINLADIDIPTNGKVVLQVTKVGNRFYTSATSFPEKMLTAGN